MNKVIGLIFVVITSGCAMQPPTALQQSNEFDNVRYQSDSGRTWTVKGFKDEYQSVTGNILLAPSALSCKWDSLCYYNAYAKAYDNGINDFNFSKSERLKAERIRKEEACNADKKCLKNKNIEINKENLKSAYQYVLFDSPYDQGSADYTVRAICKNATTAQKNGYAMDDFLNALRDEPGASPQGRAIAIKIASACWNLSSLGQNWNEALR